MADLSQPITFSFVIVTIAVVLIVSAMAIVLVKMRK